MKTIEEYLSPEIDIVEVYVERGFDNSMEDPNINDEIEW